MYIADLHIHSRYSRATSKDCTPEYLDLWARKKGIQIVGCGDFTHPAWRQELEEKLEPAEDGLYVLKREYRIQDKHLDASESPRFVITGEISSIYKKNGKTRKVHNLILLPGLEDAQRISHKLELIGNIHSDGRPILGLDSRDLLEIVLEQSERSMFVPAHIWTPHFSLFGAFSGFDTVEECFEDLTPYIHAVETGLSSDPPMNWRVSALDRFQLISNSDAHSPAKLGREANLMDIELSYEGLYQGIQEGKGLYGTIEFFPEEGKYHFDGHRKCNLCLSPAKASELGNICPVCGKKLTIGVSHRIEELADRKEGYRKENARPFESLVPLAEVIGASVGHAPSSVKVQREYERLLSVLGSEFAVLREIPLEEIQSVSGYLVAEGIHRLRARQVEKIPGFDGEYGTIKLFDPYEIEDTNGQISLFSCLDMNQKEEKKPKKTAKYLKEKKKEAFSEIPLEIKQELNTAQQEAAESIERVTAVSAGPGTGKTKTLISHILYLIENRKVKPSQITAVTFTNKAAAQLRERLQKQLGRKKSIANMQIGTFHSICLKLLREDGEQFLLADEMETLELAQELKRKFAFDESPRDLLREISLYKTGGKVRQDEKLLKAALVYEERLARQNVWDFDDLLIRTLNKLERGDFKQSASFTYLLVDEFQDINPLQYRLIQAWNQKGRGLFVIGDKDQSIYGFRGSDSGCFDRLYRDWPQIRKITLEENYRCSPEILKTALELIDENPGEPRILRPNCPSGRQVRLVTAETELSEAVFAAKEINRMVGGMDMLDAQEGVEEEERKIRSFGEIAVLYRTHRQALLLEKCLKKESIPYVVAGRDDFLMEKTVRGTICFFRWLLLKDDTLSLEVFRKIFGDLDESVLTEEIERSLEEKFRPLAEKARPDKVLKQWMKEMQLEEDEGLQKLEKTAEFYKNTSQFLEALSLGVESDLCRMGGKKVTADAVTLMTLHGAKGLEFPAVILLGASKGLIPLESKKHPSDPLEERRLFYVGITRAKEELVLTCAGEASPFLEGAKEVCIQKAKKGGRFKDEKIRQLSLFEFMSEK